MSQTLAGLFKESYLTVALITADYLSSPERVILEQRLMVLWRLVALKSRLRRALGDHPYSTLWLGCTTKTT